MSSSEENIDEEFKKICEYKYKKKYERYLPKEEHYYFKDSKGKEWSFTEINGSALYYYFKCTISKCKAFGKILRNNQKEKKFELTKEHNLIMKNIHIIK